MLSICFNRCVKYQNIKNNPERISKISPFINQCNWKERNFPAHKKDWKKFELNNKSIVFNIIFVPYNTENIRLAYESKYNIKRKNQVILLMITDGKKWHYLSVKKLSALITSNNKNYFHSYSTKNKLEKHEKVCNDLDYCYVEMPEKNNQILKYNHGEKLMKSLFIIHANLECLLKKMHSCQNNPEKLSTAKINMHTPSG